MLNKVKEKKAKVLTVLLLCFGMLGYGQEHSENDGHNHSKPTKAQIDSILHANVAPKEHADLFGTWLYRTIVGV